MLTRFRSAASSLIVLLAGAVACSDDPHPTAIAPTVPAADKVTAAAPAPLVNLNVDGNSVTLWPYTDDNLDGQPSDPVNLIFRGVAGAANVRAALMSLSGTRAGPFAPFTCTWTDAIGGEQAAYAHSAWSGSVVQLECGDYQALRFHVRIFPAGDLTVANAHLDVIIQGTADHQVLSWELAEQFVLYDLSRSGLLTAGPAQTGGINSAPTFREIPPVIYNALSPPLRALTGGPLDGSVTSGVGIANDGSATILALRSAPPASGSSQAFTITYDQVIPKPVCNAGTDFLRVDGPVDLRKDVRVSEDGSISSQTFISGDLTVRAVNTSTGGVGDPMDARVRNHYSTHLDAWSHVVRSTIDQQLSTSGRPERNFRQLRVGSGGPAWYSAMEACN